MKIATSVRASHVAHLILIATVRTCSTPTQTMESKKVKGLYFAGEILDVDGICGGYNLQWAWSSGAAAGKCAGRESDK